MPVIFAWLNIVKNKEKIINETSWLNNHYSKVDYCFRLYCLNNDIKNVNCLPKCKICGKPNKFLGKKNKPFTKFCSNKCRYSPEGKKLIVKQTKETTKKKYGDENYRNFEKMRKTKLDRYGDEYYTNKEKIKKTVLDKYGVTCVFKSNDVKDKIKITKKQKYGDETFTNTKKAKATNLKRYDVVHPMQLESFQNKLKETCLKKYGVDNPSKSNCVKKILSKKNKVHSYEGFITNLNNKYLSLLESKEEFISKDIHLYLCLRCLKTFTSQYTNIQRVFCSHCSSHRSKYEDEIFYFLTNKLKIDRKILCKNKTFTTKNKNYPKHYELDIYCEKEKIGIEFHGLYWHSDLFKHRNYHQKKQQYFKHELNIDVIQIFENEWINLTKRSIIESIISNSFNKTFETVYARHCEVDIVNNNVYKRFLENNHIQSYRNASIKIGLFFKSNLISVMSLQNLSPNTYELIRFCTYTNKNVVGGFSKLLKYFERNYKPKLLKSFVNLRLFNGEGYIKNGFVLSHITKPNYFYFKKSSNVLESRLKFQKHRLKNKLDNFDESLSAHQNIMNNGYLRIFDAGNLCLLKSF